MSDYDTWLATNPADSQPFELSFGEWMGGNPWRDVPSEWEEQFPFEDTHCAICETTIGGYLGYDEETSADVSRYETIWILPDERGVCEDCCHPEEVE